MELTVKVEGLKSALKAMNAAFPRNPRQQQRLLSAAARQAAKTAMLPTAKSLAMRGDSSGALSESLDVRLQSRRKLRRRGIAAGAEIVPVRFNVEAIRKYVQHYYINRGKTPSIDILASGIRHGHLVEWGFTHASGKEVTGHPYLWPAGRTGASLARKIFAGILRKKTEAAVRRAAKKRIRR
jgi:hypothetical protein